MIFKPASNLTKEEKTFFIEKVGVYTRLLELHAKSKGESFAIDANIDKNSMGELMNIGVVSDDQDIEALKSVLGRDKFNNFIYAVNYFLHHKKETEPIVFRLRNKSRKALQNASDHK